MFENEYLSELWDVENGNFSIKKGRVMFQNNPRLCYNKIEKFAKSLKIEISEADVSPYSNGDKEICKKKMNFLQLALPPIVSGGGKA